MKMGNRTGKRYKEVLNRLFLWWNLNNKDDEYEDKQDQCRPIIGQSRNLL